MLVQSYPGTALPLAAPPGDQTPGAVRSSSYFAFCDERYINLLTPQINRHTCFCVKRYRTRWTMTFAGKRALVTGASRGIRAVNDQFRSAAPWLSHNGPGCHCREIAMLHRNVLLLTAFVLIASAAHAESLSPINGASIHLGDTAGVAYYTVDQDAFQVVVTLAQGETGTPVRVIGTLNPGQSITFSTPNEVNTLPNAVEIRREGGKILVESAPIQ